MDTRKTIKKILFVSMWLVIGAGMITLLAAAIRNQKNEKCADYAVHIKGAKTNLFVDQKDVVKLLASGNNGKIRNQPRSAFDLRKLEQLLESNVWIKDAELYFDNKNVLQVTIIEREPVARVFTVAGKSFYIDQEEKRMPLSDKISAKVPVFTGFPNKVLASRDSMLLHQVKAIADIINNDPFWTAQVAQMDITADREFEMVPVVGNHIVKFGTGEDAERKFQRLFVFYKNVTAKAGFDKYQTIDVQYAGQVIGTKGTVSKVDSIQFRKNIEKLLQQARELQNDSVYIAPRIAQPGIEASTETTNNVETTNATLSGANGPNPLKLSESNSITPPKAVMRRQGG